MTRPTKQSVEALIRSITNGQRNGTTLSSNEMSNIHLGIRLYRKDLGVDFGRLREILYGHLSKPSNSTVVSNQSKQKQKTSQKVSLIVRLKNLIAPESEDESANLLTKQVQNNKSNRQIEFQDINVQENKSEQKNRQMPMLCKKCDCNGSISKQQGKFVCDNGHSTHI